MTNDKIRLNAYLFILLVLMLSGCGNARSLREGDTVITSTTSSGIRDNTPEVLVPSLEGENMIGNDKVTINISNSSEGYIVVRYTGDIDSVKLQLTGENNVTYTFDIQLDKPSVIPLSADSGTYKLDVYEHIESNQYAMIYSTTFDVEITNTNGPFLYPNMYVDFNKDSKVVALAEELTESATSDLDAVSKIYDYVINNITYDHEKAETVQPGYIPVVDEILEKKTGICFDYASMMAAMLRSQRIPTRLEIGYAGDAYHAWISIFTPDTGWLEGMIVFDGTTWSLVDPTFAANTQDSSELKDFIGDGTNYFTKYVY